MTRRAFTLIELLVALAIIGTLLAILVPMLQRARQAAGATQCVSRLRELYASEMIYAQQNRDRMTPVAYANKPSPYASGASSWRAALASVLRVDHDANLFECPSRADTTRSNTYGINSCIMMPQWNLHTSRRTDTTQVLDTFRTDPASVKPFSQMILFADKGAADDDVLRSNDGFSYFLDHYEGYGDTPSWEMWSRHNPYGAYRHKSKNGQAANAVFMDGHVGAVRDELFVGNGHLFFGTNPTWIKIVGEPCCQ